MAPASKNKGTAKGAKNVALDVSDTPEATNPKAICAFCHQPDIQGQNEVEKAGRLFKFMGKYYHYFCILFSFGVKQSGEDVGLKGFTLHEIQKVLKTGESKKCAYCSKKGATAKCNKCSKNFYHYTCGTQNDVTFIFHGSMASFCKKHRPKQTIKAKVKEKVCVAGCLEKISDKDPKVMVSPCCFRRYHLNCVQLQALSAGSHHFKCCMCSDKDKFPKVAASLGIYIPVQDATWEQEERFYGFEEQGRLYSKCDSTKCLCPKGRKYTLNGSKFELIRCEQCGSSAVHIKCGNLLKKAPFYVCKDHDNAKEQMEKHKADIKNNPDYSSEEESEAEPVPSTPSPRKRVVATAAEATKSSSKTPKVARKKKKLSPRKKATAAAPRRRSPVKKTAEEKKVSVQEEEEVVCLSSSSDDETLWETRSFLNSKDDKMKETPRPDSPIQLTAEGLAADLLSCLASDEDDRSKSRRPHGQRARLFTLLHPQKPRLRIPLQPPPQPSVHSNQPESSAKPRQSEKTTVEKPVESAGKSSSNQKATSHHETYDVIDEVCPVSQVRPSLSGHLQPRQAPPVPRPNNRSPSHPSRPTVPRPNHSQQLRPAVPVSRPGYSLPPRQPPPQETAQFTPGPATLLTFSPLLPTAVSSQLPQQAAGVGQSTVIPSLVKTWDAATSNVVNTQPEAIAGQNKAQSRRSSLYGEMVPTFGIVPQAQHMTPAPQGMPAIGAAFSLGQDIPTVVEVNQLPSNGGLVIGYDSDGAPIYHQQFGEVVQGSQDVAVVDDQETVFVMDGIVNEEPTAAGPVQPNDDEIIVLD